MGRRRRRGRQYWLQALTEIKNRGAEDVCMVVCDGLKGPPDAIGAVWPQAVTQTCVVHLLRASFHFAARQDWDKISKALKPVCTTNAIESVNARIRKAVRARGHFPNEQAAIKCAKADWASRSFSPWGCMWKGRRGRAV